MNGEFWLGTESALIELVQTERLLENNFVDMMDRRKAFLDGGEDGGMESKGDYLISQVGGTAVIKVSGSLTNGYRWHHEFMDGRVTSYEAIGDALATAASDPDIKDIVLDINSGGGSVTGIDALGQQIRRVDNIKPVRAYTETAAFSAAYWIASSSREIIAGSRMAEVGSIGTLMVHQSVAKMASEMGIDFTVFRAGKYKALGLPYEELTDDVKAYMQADLDKANSFFLEHVSLRRSLMVSEKERWAEGKTFFAGEAKDVGLIDRVASLDEIVSAPGASNQRRERMFISEEKRAQIAAGARPEDVLTAEELTQYQAELESNDESEGAGEEDNTPGTEASEGEGGDNGEPSSDEGLSASAGLQQDYREALRLNGKLEAKLEAEKAKAEAAEQKLKTAEAQASSLLEVGKLAVHNLQVALGMPKETPATAEAMVTAYNDLQATMAKRFTPGRQSSEDPAGDQEDLSANTPLAFRAQIKK